MSHMGFEVSSQDASPPLLHTFLAVVTPGGGVVYNVTIQK